MTVHSCIVGTGQALPEQVLSNAALAQTLGVSDDWIKERTGISERRILSATETTSDLAAEAARQALTSAQLLPTAIDCVICATVTPDRPMPSLAAEVLGKLGARCAAFDVAAACAGFVYALSVADAFVRAGQFRRVLVIGAEALSRVVDWKDRNTSVLFADGAGAVVLAPSDGDQGILSTHLFGDGAESDLLHIPAGGAREPASLKSVEQVRHTIEMNGPLVFLHAVKNLVSAGKETLAANRLSASDIDWVIAHQANRRVLEAVADRLEIGFDRFLLNIDRVGNTSAASIPMVLDDAVRSNRLRSGDRILLAALGSGLVWGTAMVKW